MRRRVGWSLAALAVVAVFLPLPAAGVGAAAAAVTAAFVVDRRVLGAVLRVGVVLAIVFSSAVAGAVVAWSSDWGSGRDVAVSMLLRLVVFLIVTGLLARNVDAEALLRGGRRLGLERLGLILGLALNVLPQLGEATRQVVMAWRVRRRTRAGHVPSLVQLLEVLLAHVARIADDAAAAAALRGHAALLQPRVVVARTTPLVVVTGDRGSGKTTALLEVAERARAAGWRVAGFVQPARLVGGERVGFAVRDLLGGEEAVLARLVPRDDGEHGTRFQFLENGIALARQALARVRGGDLLIVDELGPLELRGQGHMPAVQRALRVPDLLAVVVVVRAQLVPALLAMLRVDDATVVEVTGIGDTEAVLTAVSEARRETPGRSP